MNENWFKSLINKMIDKIDNNMIDIIFSGNKKHSMMFYNIVSN